MFYLAFRFLNSLGGKTKTKNFVSHIFFGFQGPDLPFGIYTILDSNLPICNAISERRPLLRNTS